MPNRLRADDEYNLTDPEETDDSLVSVWISYHNPSAQQRADLVAFADGAFGVGDAQDCTTIWTDAWVVADADVVAFAGGDDLGGLLEITVEGPLACDYGELLLVSATRWWWEGHWEYGTGRNWTENFDRGFTVTGDYIFTCERVVDPEDDLVEVADLVPSTQVNHNPLVVGLTGLDTWYWYDFTQPNSSVLSISTSIAAFGFTYPITATAWVDQVWWDPDCANACDWRGMLAAYDAGEFDHDLVLDLPDTVLSPAPVYDGGDGTEDAHAASYLYETKGDYTMATATVRRGFYSYHGVDHRYDPVLVISSAPFPVCELRGVLTTPGEEPNLNTCEL